MRVGAVLRWWPGVAHIGALPTRPLTGICGALVGSVDEACEAGGYLGGLVGQYTSIGAQRHGRIGVAEASRNDVDGEALLEREGGVDVAQIMELDPGQGSGALGKSVVVSRIRLPLGGRQGLRVPFAWRPLPSSPGLAGGCALRPIRRPV